MIKSTMLQTIYQMSIASFCTIVVISNILSAKMVTLPFLAISIPAGLIPYPFTFLFTDFVTEIFGARRAKLMVYITLAMSLLSFGMIQVALLLPTDALEDQAAFQTVLGASGLRIFSSLVSYITSQLVGIWLYTAIRQWTGPKFLWLRNNGATFASQMLDTAMIDIIFLWWGLGMPTAEVGRIMVFSYAYKAAFGVLCTPLFYGLVFLVRGRNLRPQAALQAAI